MVKLVKFGCGLSTGYSLENLNLKKNNNNNSKQYNADEWCHTKMNTIMNNFDGFNLFINFFLTSL